MHTLGRSIAKSVGIFGVLAMLYVLVSGLAYPKALEPIDAALCPGSASLMTDDRLLDTKRNFDGRSYAQFCQSHTQLVDVTSRWILLVVSCAFIGAIGFIVQVKITPPSLRAPDVPAGH